MTDIRSQPCNQPHPFVCRFSSSLHRPASFSPFVPRTFRGTLRSTFSFVLFEPARSTFEPSERVEFGIVTRNNFLVRPSTFYGLTSCPEQPGCHKNFVASLSEAWPCVDKTKFNATRCEEFRMTVVCAGRPTTRQAISQASLNRNSYENREG